MSLRHALRNQTIGWNICDKCGQSHSVENELELAKEDEPWECSMNTWNPGVAYCWSEDNFFEDYKQWLAEKNVPFTQPTIQGDTVNFWSLYNFVTQMGGWNSVVDHGLVPYIYEYHQWSGTDVGNRLKAVYETHLLEWEKKMFHGKRYATAEEISSIFRPLDSPESPQTDYNDTQNGVQQHQSFLDNGNFAADIPIARPIDTEARPRKKKKTQSALAVDDGAPPRKYTLKGAKVWVKIEGAPWWPAQLVTAAELKYVVAELDAEFRESKANTLLRLYGCNELYYCDSSNNECIVPWEFRIPVHSPIYKHNCAIVAAQKGSQTVKLTKDESGVEKMPHNKGRRRCSDVVPGTFEGQPEYNTLEEEERVLINLETELKARLQALIEEIGDEDDTQPPHNTNAQSENDESGIETEKPEKTEKRATSDGPKETKEGEGDTKPPKKRPRCVSVSTAELASAE